MLNFSSAPRYHVIHGSIVYTKNQGCCQEKWIKMVSSTVMVPLNQFWDPETQGNLNSNHVTMDPQSYTWIFLPNR